MGLSDHWGLRLVTHDDGGVVLMVVLLCWLTMRGTKSRRDLCCAQERLALCGWDKINWLGTLNSIYAAIELRLRLKLEAHARSE